MYRNYFSIVFLGFFFILTFLFAVLDKVTPVFALCIIIASCVAFYIFKTKNTTLAQERKGRHEAFMERLNLIEDELKKKNNILRELPQRSQRIFSIKDVTQRFVDITEPDMICKAIVEELSSIFPEADNILLFLLPKNRDYLMLEQSFRKKNEIIREKKGDILDWWVLKNNQSLLIENLSSDFRFDTTQTVPFRERNARSIVSSPLSIGPKVMGLVRCESKKENAFSLEDSRALRVVCDLGVVVLERVNLFKRTKELATKDSLTDLFLRNYFLERFEEEIKRSAHKKTQFGLCILDVDDFKKVNDTHGHTVGDMVLKKVAAILKKNVGNSGNVISRLGGEEFVFLIVESDKTSVKRIAERIRKDIQKSIVSFRRKMIHCTVSMGLAMYPKDGLNSQQLLMSADKLLYQAKGEGKNKVCSM